MSEARRTVLLARPGEARERLRSALENEGVEVVLVANPLEADVEEVISANPRNLVIALDAETEDALDRFQALLSDRRYRVLFEEVALIESRGGWDIARWSRHLGAKLLGHGDVLPTGHELDEPQPPRNVREESDGSDSEGEDAAADVDIGTDNAEQTHEAVDESTQFELPDTTSSSLDDDMQLVADDVLPDAAREAESSQGYELGLDALSEEEASTSLEQGEDFDFAATQDDNEVLEPPTGGEAEWLRFQDFEAVSGLPAANAPQATENDYRSALAPLDDHSLPHDQAYQRLEEEMAGFGGDTPADRWQDFERPVLDAAPDEEAIEKKQRELPVAPDWSLLDESTPAVAPAMSSAGVHSDANADVSLERRDGVDDFLANESATQVAMSPTSSDAEPAIVANGGGIVLLAGGIGGPDPLRQILQQLGKGLNVPLLVQQWLDGGQYDRLVRQMDRASAMTVELAQAGTKLVPGRVYIVPVAMTAQQDPQGGLHFVDAPGKGFADILSKVPAASSGVVLLSGASQDYLEQVNRFMQAGGRVFAQSAVGCYDHTVPGLLIQSGIEGYLPTEIATQLAARWQY